MSEHNAEAKQSRSGATSEPVSSAASPRSLVAHSDTHFVAHFVGHWPFRQSARRSLGNGRFGACATFGAAAGLILLCLVFTACHRQPDPGPAAAVDPHLQTNGTFEVTAKLVEIPEGAIFQRELYDYATILKYEVVKVHRGEIKGSTIYVGQYNPFKPRSEAADARVKQIGGNLGRFRAGQVQRMALAAPIEDQFMGGIVNKYFGMTGETIYWAVWTNLERE